MRSNEELVKLLIENKLHITTCESCTGGLIANQIISISGSSAILNEAYITYAPNSKVDLVGVNKNTIDKYGVVSSEVAFEMAKCAAKKANAELAISATGVAGPTGGDKINPVGTIWFGFQLMDKTFTVKKVFINKSRNQVRQLGAQFAIRYMLNLIKNEFKII